MDVSVGHLNHRLALQLPRELPLGLVFVVGVIDGWRQARSTGHTRPADKTQYCFELVDEPYRIHCRLLVKTLSELDLANGDRVRVGGHLRFDAQQAHYYLLARDIERLDEANAALIEPDEKPDEAEVAALLADIRKRDKSAGLPRAEMPVWVQQLAPNSVLRETAVSPHKPAETETAAALPDELVAYLSGAMERDEEVELTPQMLARFWPEATAETAAAPVQDAPQSESPMPAQSDDEAMRDEPVRLDPAKAAQCQQRPQNEIDWLVVLLVLGLLVVATIAAIMLLSG